MCRDELQIDQMARRCWVSLECGHSHAPGHGGADQRPTARSHNACAIDCACVARAENHRAPCQLLRHHRGAASPAPPAGYVLLTALTFDAQPDTDVLPTEAESISHQVVSPCREAHLVADDRRRLPIHSRMVSHWSW